MALTEEEYNALEEDDFHNVSEDLFKCENGSSFSFYVVPCVERKRIQKMIELGGGKVENESGPYTITLVPPAMAAFLGGDEVFGYDFIYSCCVKNSLQDLKLYRVGFHSRKFEEYNPMDVLQQQLKWDDVPLLQETNKDEGSDIKTPSSSVSPEKDSEPPTNSGDQPNLFFTTGIVEKISTKEDRMLEKLKRRAKRKLPTQDEPLFMEEEEEESVASVEKPPLQEHKNQEGEHTDSSEDADVSSYSKNQEGEQTDSTDDVDVSSSSKHVKNMVPKNIKKPRKQRREYEEYDRRLIVKYIQEKEAFDQVKGTKIWLELEASDILEGRTWQSLKEHFIKKIIPNIRYYKLPPEVVQKFKRPFKKT